MRRTYIYVTRVAIPGLTRPKFHLITRLANRKKPKIETLLYTQTEALKIAIRRAKTTTYPTSVVLQGVDGQWREEFSYPAVRNNDER